MLDTSTTRQQLLSSQRACRRFAYPSTEYTWNVFVSRNITHSQVGLKPYAPVSVAVSAWTRRNSCSDSVPRLVWDASHIAIEIIHLIGKIATAILCLLIL